MLRLTVNQIRTIAMDARDLQALLTLQAVARAGGFAAAARELGSTRAAVSRVIAEAESRTGVRLCHRTTRRVTLTEAARALLHAAEDPLQAVQSAWSALPDAAGAFRGTLRVSCSHALGRAFVLPAATRYRAEHPQVSVEVRLADVYDDLVTRGLDVAVRLGPLPDSSLVARTLGRIAVLPVAAPSLLRGARRPPRTLADLEATLPVVAFQAPGSGLRRHWRVKGDGRVEHPFASPALVVDSIEGVADLARAGAGAGLAPRYLVEEDLRARRLVALLPELSFEGPELHLCHAHRTLVPPRVRAFMDQLAQALQPALA